MTYVIDLIKKKKNLSKVKSYIFSFLNIVRSFTYPIAACPLLLLILLVNKVSIQLILKVDSLESWASLIAQLVKNPPAMQETPVRFLGQEDLLEKELPTPVFWPGEFQDCIVHGVTKSRTQLSNFHLLPWSQAALTVRILSYRPGIQFSEAHFPNV